MVLCKMVLRRTALITSAYPATARAAQPTTTPGDSPKRAMPAPQVMTAMTIMRPRRFTPDTHPVVVAPSKAPMPGAALSQPRVIVPP